ncbi:hypothetical protein SAMN06265337_1962 [Hymenobacter gelipurpurascens]|uniref:Uncharacterized protein n=1 Tax=Hymenobacter gelipurpurascens TaxID=89968 RepID=A0A212TN43_9BACT|nr:hypothetical protein [Hymenobacter gelipurpurascens]SNC67469.1 hypothetical protein SAMN06265337_1962 [Hymenobacter gelipurpurascens]
MNPQQLARDVKFLKTYTLGTTAALVVLVFCAFSKPEKIMRFGEISVERLNLIEPDGTVKMIMANKERFPQGVTIDGKHIDYKRSNPGMLFYNDKGEECGGLIFGGQKDAQGKVQAGGHFSLDRFGQDQVIALTYQQQGPNYTAGLTFNDAPEESVTAMQERYKNATPEEKTQAQREGKLGLLPRVYMGTTRSKSSALLMNDQQGDNRVMLLANDEQSTLDFKDSKGRLRLTIGVDAKNQPVVRFFDEAGKEAKTIGL